MATVWDQKGVLLTEFNEFETTNALKLYYDTLQWLGRKYRTKKEECCLQVLSFMTTLASHYITDKRSPPEIQIGSVSTSALHTWFPSLHPNGIVWKELKANMYIRKLSHDKYIHHKDIYIEK